MRAYVAPDGSSAEYNENNIPFQPKKYLQVSADGVNEEDFVFILGYPGRTYRHRTSHFFRMEEEVYKPYIVNLYGWLIDVMEKLSKKDRSTEIKLAPRLKGLWNVMKKYKGQLKAMKNLKLADRKSREEKELQTFIDSDPKRKEKYGSLLDEIGKLIKVESDETTYDSTLSYLRRTSTLLGNAYLVYEASIELKKKDTERERAYMKRNFDRTKKYMIMGLRNFSAESERIILKKMLLDAAKFKGKYKIQAVRDIIDSYNAGNAEKAIDAFLDKTLSQSRFNDKEYLEKMLTRTTKELDAMDAPFLVLARKLYPVFQQLKAKQKSQKGLLDKLSAQLLEVKQLFKGTNFIPDANSTLRLTYGRIRGYSPADAVTFTPFSTLTGVIEKNTNQYPFIATEKLGELYKKRDFGRYTQKELNDVPVNILYSTDTTGGNSGSPVLNAKGQLIGLNFDRVYEATINDYGWDESYSRSIGVDIRYILWFLDKFGKAGHLLKEMNIR